MIIRVFLLCFFTSVSFLQIQAQAEILFSNAEKNEVPVFNPEEKLDKEKMERTVLLPMPYASPNLIDERIRNEFKSSKIKSINLYYTDYPKGRNLDKLNTNRINNLISTYEEVLDSNIVWTINRQMACQNMQEANEMFHGFEIVLDIMKSKDLAYYHLQKGEQESIVEEVFERNEWDSMLVVADFTGSMSPYISQLLLWVKLNNKQGKVSQFIFFNDGNGRSDKYKLLGKTGGIYPVRSPIYGEIEYTAKKCRKAGNGGDIPENDIEALLAGMKLCADCKELVLIADNFSDVRDIALSLKIEEPLRIILCGVKSGYINPVYLNLARRTKGSVHLMEKDLKDLASLNEGEILEVDSAKFIVVKGEFVLLEDE